MQKCFSLPQDREACVQVHAKEKGNEFFPLLLDNLLI